MFFSTLPLGWVVFLCVCLQCTMVNQWELQVASMNDRWKSFIQVPRHCTKGVCQGKGWNTNYYVPSTRPTARLFWVKSPRVPKTSFLTCPVRCKAEAGWWENTTNPKSPVLSAPLQLHALDAHPSNSQIMGYGCNNATDATIHGKYVLIHHILWWAWRWLQNSKLVAIQGWAITEQVGEVGDPAKCALWGAACMFAYCCISVKNS